MDQINQSERRLGRGADEDEVERCVMAIGHERGGVGVNGRVAGGGGGSEYGRKAEDEDGRLFWKGRREEEEE